MEALIESKLYKLKKQLEDYRSKKKKAEKEQRELNTVITKIRKKADEIEEGLQETLSTVEKRLKKLNPKSRFRVKYLGKVKEFLLNPSSSSAVADTREAERKAKIKYLDLDDSITYYIKRIRELEREIDDLQKMLKQMGD